MGGAFCFERIHHTVKLTAKGRSVQRLAHEMLQAAEDMKRAAGESRCLKGTIRAAMAASLCTQLFCRDFYKLSPAVSGHFSDSDDRNNGGNVSDAESERSGSGVYSGHSYL